MVTFRGSVSRTQLEKYNFLFMTKHLSKKNLLWAHGDFYRVCCYYSFLLLKGANPNIKDIKGTDAVLASVISRKLKFTE